MTQPNVSDDLNQLYALALIGQPEAITNFLQRMDRYVRHHSYLNGYPSEDLVQDVRLELYLEIVKQTRGVPPGEPVLGQPRFISYGLC